MTGKTRTTPNLAPRQFGKNLAVNVASLLVSVATGFFLAPFLVRRLGVAGYGLPAVIASVVSYLHVANIALNSAVVRHLSVAVTQEDHDRARAIFNTSLWGSVAVSAVLMVAGAVASANAPALVNVPPGLERDAAVLFLTATGGVALTLASSPLSVAIYYSNRLDKKGMIDLWNRVTYAVLVVVLVARVAPRPSMIGIALLASTVVGTVQTALWSRRCMPWLTPRFSFQWSIFREMTWFGGWSLVAYAGNLVFLTADLIVINRLIGPTEGGIYAILLQWPGLIRSFATVAANVFSQPMAHLYAKDGPAALFGYSVGAVRKTAVLVLMAVVAIGGSAEPLLRMWLGPKFAGYWPLLLLLVAPLGLNLVGSPLVTALQTILKVRVLGIVTLVVGVLNVLVAVILVRTTALGMWAIAGTSAVSLTLLASGVIPFYASREFGRSPKEVLEVLGRAGFVALGGCLAGSALTSAVHVSSWLGLAFHALVLAAATGFASAYLVLGREERSFVLRTAREWCAYAVMQAPRLGRGLWRG